MKISEIIDKLEAYHGPLEPERRTCLNFIEITIDMLLYFRNVKLDKENEGK